MLEDLVTEAKDIVLATSLRLGRTHTASSLSILEIIACVLAAPILESGSTSALESQMMDDGRFQLILSKAHGVLSLYAFLAATGHIPRESLRMFKHPEVGGLPGEPDPSVSRLLGLATGPLGGGLALALGWQLSHRHADTQPYVVTILGDGECQKGQIWEAAFYAPSVVRGRFLVVVDHNRLQLDGPTNEVFMAELSDVWQASGWHVMQVDGHDINELTSTFREGLEYPGPTVVIAHTVKGHGVPEMENSPHWHYFRGSPQKPLLAAMHEGQELVAEHLPPLEDSPPQGRPRDWVIEELVKIVDDPRIEILAADLLHGTGLDLLNRDFNAWSNVSNVGCLHRLPLAENLMFRMAEGLIAGGKFPVVGIFESLMVIALLELHACIVAAEEWGGGGLILAAKPGRSSDDGPSMRAFASLPLLWEVPGLRVLDPRDECELRRMVSHHVTQGSGIAIIRVADQLSFPKELPLPEAGVAWIRDFTGNGTDPLVVFANGWVFATIASCLATKHVDRHIVLVGLCDIEQELQGLSSDTLRDLCDSREVLLVTDVHVDSFRRRVADRLVAARVSPIQTTSIGPKNPGDAKETWDALRIVEAFQEAVRNHGGH